MHYDFIHFHALISYSQNAFCDHDDDGDGLSLLRDGDGAQYRDDGAQHRDGGAQYRDGDGARSHGDDAQSRGGDGGALGGALFCDPQLCVPSASSGRAAQTLAAKFLDLKVLFTFRCSPTHNLVRPRGRRPL